MRGTRRSRSYTGSGPSSRPSPPAPSGATPASGAANLARFSKVALVTDIPWMRGAVRVFAPLVPAEVQVFRDKEFDAAKAWIAAEEAAKGARGEG